MELIQIKEGLLAGLDASFVRGLNIIIIIGERGTSKISFIELRPACPQRSSSAPSGNPHQRIKSYLARSAAEGLAQTTPAVLSFVRDWRTECSV